MIDCDVVSLALTRRAQETPDAPFVKCGSEWLTFGALDASTSRLAGGLAQCGVGPGDHVALLVPNRQEMVELFFALAKLGAVQIPLNAWLRGEFLAYQLRDSQPQTLITDAAGYASAMPLFPQIGLKRVVLLDEIAELDTTVDHVAFADVALGDPRRTPTQGASAILSIIYTSGTTGLPKGCMLSHGYYTTTARVISEHGWMRPGDRLFTSWPLFHTSGQVVALMNALIGEGSVVIEPDFSASTFMRSAADHFATVLCGVGFMGAAILAQPPSSDDERFGFRLAIWVPMAPEAQLAFEARFKTPVYSESFGQTECFPITMATSLEDRVRGTLGPPSPHVDIRLVDGDDNDVVDGTPGELVLRPRIPHAMFSGYWGKPEATSAAWHGLWHHTGDLARRGEQGSLVFVDRKKDSIRRRGENVSSVELEASITMLPGVAEVAVCAVPSLLGGEDDIKAVIVPKGDPPLEPGETFSYFRDHLPYFAIPRYVQIRSQLPRNGLGRVMKHVLREEGVPSTVWDFEAMGLRIEKSERR